MREEKVKMRERRRETPYRMLQLRSSEMNELLLFSYRFEKDPFAE